MVSRTPLPSVALTASSLGCDVGERPLLSDVTFDVRSGEALLVRGPNGVGKTTLLRTLAGLERPARGECCVVEDGGDKPWPVWEDNTAIHLLGHRNALKAAQTVSRNLAFWRRFDPRPGASEAKVADALDLTRLLHLPVAVLSAGQQRRAAFARLLVSRRPIWILDEPTASLDTASSALIEEACRRHLEDNGVVIAATHLPFLRGHPAASAIDLAADRPSRTGGGHG